MGWSDIIYLVLFHLEATCESECSYQFTTSELAAFINDGETENVESNTINNVSDPKYTNDQDENIKSNHDMMRPSVHIRIKFYHWKVVIDYIRLYWGRFFVKPIPNTNYWQNSLLSHLSVLLSLGKVISGKEIAKSGSKYLGFYGIVDKSFAPIMLHKTRPVILFKVLPSGTLALVSEIGQDCHYNDINNSLKSTKEKRREIDSLDFDRQNPMGNEKVRISRLPSLSNSTLQISQEGLMVSAGKNYRTAKASHGCFAGCWYFEVSILTPAYTHVRVGWAQGLSDLHSPVGFDEFGYGFSDMKRSVFHTARPLARFEDLFIDTEQKLVIGVLIHLPLPSNDERDYDMEALVHFQTKYPPRRLADGYLVTQRLLNGSYIEIFINGKSLGKCCDSFGLYRGKYYPAISVYDGSVVANFGEEPFLADFSNDCRRIYPVSKLAGYPEPFDFDTSKFLQLE